jgi:O-methyltransferase involved in polyketide biosynthesis
MKIVLSGAMETLLIPLYGRAQMSRRGLSPDADAEQAVARIDYDFSRLKIHTKTQMMLSVRSALIDNYTTAYLQEHRDARVLYLGCGLDPRAKRLRYPAVRWYDLDFPEVIAIKRQLFDETPCYIMIASSVTESGWLDAVDGGGDVLVIAEGLFMYLGEDDIRTLFDKLRQKFVGVTLIFDAYSRATVKHSAKHPSLKRTGAVIRWGVDAPAEIEAYGGIRHEKTLYLTDEEAVMRLPKGSRLIYSIAGNFRVAREAHRIFVMSLTG